jgi:hypothetical protein
VLKVLISAIKQDREIKGTQMRKNKTSLFAYGMMEMFCILVVSIPNYVTVL